MLEGSRLVERRAGQRFEAQRCTTPGTTIQVFDINILFTILSCCNPTCHLTAIVMEVKKNSPWAVFFCVVGRVAVDVSNDACVSLDAIKSRMVHEVGLIDRTGLLQ